MCSPSGLETLDKLSVDALVLMPFADDQPLKGTAGFCDWRLNGRLSRIIQSGSFTAKPLEVLLTNTQGKIGTERIFLFGQGMRKEMDLEVFEKRIQEVLATIKKARINSYALELPGTHPGPLSFPQVMPAFLDVVTSFLPDTTLTLLCPAPKNVELISKIVAGDNRVAVKPTKH